MRNGVLVLFSFMVTIHGHRILGLFPFPIKSHYIFFEKIMKELARRNHEVHVVNHFPQKVPIPNYNDIDISGSIPYEVTNISIGPRVNRGIWGAARNIFQICGSDICEHIFQHANIISLKQTKLKFDVVISELYGTDCLLGFAYYFGIPIIGVSSTDMLPWAGIRMGNPDNPSHIANYFLATNKKMLIYEKVAIVAATFLTKIGYYVLSASVAEMKARNFFGKTFPAMEELIYNTSVLLLNSHLSINEPRPMVPGVIEVGGLHIGKPKPLNQNMELLINSAEGGVIYFSMGTVINMETFPGVQLNSLLKAFSNMTQTIIWSGAPHNVAVPENVKLFPWVEQIDILCNPHVKLFITHGGLMSIQEAAYCGKPILGIPIFPNQERNVYKYVENGAGRMMDAEYLNEFDVIEALNDLIINETYRKNSEKISSIFKDRPMSPLDNAMYWIEYVIRFNGAPHLKTKSSELIWFEYYLVDVIMLAAVFFYVFFFFFKKTLNFIQNQFDNRSLYEKKKVV